MPDYPKEIRGFDRYAKDYGAMHARSVAPSGEKPEYFADYKLHRIERLVGPSFDAPVLDLGCGIGALAERLVTRFSEVVGYDPSAESLTVARGRTSAVRFTDDLASVPDAHFGLVVMAGVLHHVRPSDRDGLLRTAFGKLRPGGRVVVFEHNPLNPLTRKAVADCPFDDDAILLRPGEARRLLTDAGFADVRRTFIVFFPRPLAALRGLEPYLGAVPLGAQMMLVGERPK